MADLQQLIKNIEQWAEDRNLIEGSTPQKQFIKLMEEFGELCAGISKNNIDMIKDSIGDCFVVLTILNKQCKSDLLPKNWGELMVNDPITDDDLFKAVENFGDKELNILLTITVGSLGEFAKDILEEPSEISDLMSCFVSIGAFFRLGIKECVSSAWEEIKDRKGKMINGVFVKEADLGAKND